MISRQKKLFVIIQKIFLTTKSFAILKRDKDSSVIIIDKTDYVIKFQKMLEEVIHNGVSVLTNDTTTCSQLVINLPGCIEEY